MGWVWLRGVWVRFRKEARRRLLNNDDVCLSVCRTTSYLLRCSQRLLLELSCRWRQDVCRLRTCPLVDVCYNLLLGAGADRLRPSCWYTCCMRISCSAKSTHWSPPPPFWRLRLGCNWKIFMRFIHDFWVMFLKNRQTVRQINRRTNRETEE